MVNKQPARAVMINRCVKDAVVSAGESPDWVDSIFYNGFIGFNNMTDDELYQAYNDAGLSEFYADVD